MCGYFSPCPERQSCPRGKKSAPVSCRPHNRFWPHRKRTFLRKVHHWRPGHSNIIKQPLLLSLVTSFLYDFPLSRFPPLPQAVQSSYSSHCLSKAVSNLQNHLGLFSLPLNSHLPNFLLSLNCFGEGCCELMQVKMAGRVIRIFEVRTLEKQMLELKGT